MTQEEIIAANRKSALEQVEQDKRNDTLKAEMEAETLMNSVPPKAIVPGIVRTAMGRQKQSRGSAFAGALRGIAQYSSRWEIETLPKEDGEAHLSASARRGDRCSGQPQR
jgi:hypothetical protein